MNITFLFYGPDFTGNYDEGTAGKGKELFEVKLCEGNTHTPDTSLTTRKLATTNPISVVYSNLNNTQPRRERQKDTRIRHRASRDEVRITAPGCKEWEVAGKNWVGLWLCVRGRRVKRQRRRRRVLAAAVTTRPHKG